MTPDDLEFFKKLLDQMLIEAQQNGDSTLEDLTESPSSYADPTDRASVESDRSFTLRIRDRERPVTTLCVDCKARQEEGEDIQGS